MNTLNQNKVALTFGLFLGGWHLVWSLLVATGLAQMLYDFVLWAHMIHISIVIGPFNTTAALSLIIITFISGYVFGYVFSYLWNWLHRV